MGAAVRSYLKVSIASGAALSDRVVTGDAVLVALEMPAAWTAADITILGSRSAGGTLQDVYDASSNEVTIKADAGQFIVLDPDLFTGFGSIQLRSGTAETPVNQGAARELYLVIKEI